jgi:hypothetical protein
MAASPKYTPQPGPVNLVVKDGEGHIVPAIVQLEVSDGRSEPLRIVNETGARVTVVMPCGVVHGGSCVHVIAAHGECTVPIEVPGDLMGFEIPYGVFFAELPGEIKRDWGKAGSPPSMVVGP